MTNPDLSKLRKGDRVLVEMEVWDPDTLDYGTKPYVKVKDCGGSTMSIVDVRNIRQILPREIKVGDKVRCHGFTNEYTVWALKDNWVWLDGLYGPTSKHMASLELAE